MKVLPAQAGPSPRRGDGLYDATAEHDGCGVAAVARLDGVPLHDVVDRALTALDDLEHRGAAGVRVLHRHRAPAEHALPLLGGGPLEQLNELVATGGI